MKEKVYLTRYRMFNSGQKFSLGKTLYTGQVSGSISFLLFVSLQWSAAQEFPEPEVLSLGLMPLMNFFSSSKYLIASQNA